MIIDLTTKNKSLYKLELNINFIDKLIWFPSGHFWWSKEVKTYKRNCGW